MALICLILAYYSAEQDALTNEEKDEDQELIVMKSIEKGLRKENETRNDVQRRENGV